MRRIQEFIDGCRREVGRAMFCHRVCDKLRCLEWGTLWHELQSDRAALAVALTNAEIYDDLSRVYRDRATLGKAFRGE